MGGERRRFLTLSQYLFLKWSLPILKPGVHTLPPVRSAPQHGPESGSDGSSWSRGCCWLCWKLEASRSLMSKNSADPVAEASGPTNRCAICYTFGYLATRFVSEPHRVAVLPKLASNEATHCPGTPPSDTSLTLLLLTTHYLDFLPRHTTHKVSSPHHTLITCSWRSGASKLVRSGASSTFPQPLLTPKRPRLCQ